jgi:hypothetical protein
LPSTASFTTPSFGCHIGHSYTAEIMATAQFEEMEKVMRAAVRVLTSGLNSASRWPEHGGDAETEASKDRHAASKQALDWAYKVAKSATAGPKTLIIAMARWSVSEFTAESRSRILS